MARKVFISFLGTSNYVQTKYNINGTISNLVRFIQEALTDYYFTEWTPEDRIFIFHTDASHDLNWVDNGQSRASEEIEKIGLASIYKNKPYSNIVQGIHIAEGFTEEEVWQMFDTVYDILEEEDEIILDVTHAFRSIPLFSTVLFNFSQSIKNTHISHIHYGAFEKLGNPNKVKEISLEDRIAPVIELTNIIKLQNLTTAADDIQEFGKIGTISKAFPDTSQSTDKRLNYIILALNKEVSKLEDFILTNRLKEIEEGAFVQNIKGQMKTIRKNSSITRAQKILLDKLSSLLADFEYKGGNKNIIAATHWALKFNLVQQAYTLAQEFIITEVLNTLSNKISIDDAIMRRNFVSGILAVKDKDINEKKYEKELALNIQETEQLLNLPLIRSMRPSYSVIAGNRNILSHAKECPMSSKQFKDQLTQHFDTCLTLLHYAN